MNKKLALPAIAMFAVTLGLGIMSPALASPPGDDPHKMKICHFEEAKIVDNLNGTSNNYTSGLVVIDVDNKGKMNGHFIKGTDPAEPRHFNATHSDFVINATADSGQEESDCGPPPTFVVITTP